MKPAIERTLITGIVSAIICVVVFGIVSFWQTSRVRSNSARVRHANDVAYQLKQVVDISTRYEIHAKSYLLTGDSILPDSLRYAAAALRKEGPALRDLVVFGDEFSIAQIDSLLRLIDRNKQLLDHAVGEHQVHGPAAGTASLLAEGEAGVSRRLEAFIADLELQGKNQLEQRRKTSRENITDLQGFLMATVPVVAILMGVIVFQKNRMALSREKKARAQADSFNRELAEQVRLATAGLKASEEKYRTIFYKSPLPKWVYDLETLRFLEVNEAALRSYGYSQEEFLKMKITDIRPEEDIVPLLKDVEEVRNISGDSYHSAWRHRKKNGDIILVEITAHPMEYDNRPARMVVVNDITEQKKAEVTMQRLNEDLQKRAAELAASNGELERFAYIASHDLQEPLRMVSSFLQLLHKKYQGQLDEKADRYIHYAVDGAERMKTLIMDLLEYSRVGSGKGNFEETDANKVMEEITETFRPLIIKSRARIEIDPLPIVMADRVQLSQLFQNMIGNGLKYRSDQPPVIKVSGVEERNAWLFSVSDNGIGIDPLYFDKIFIIFQRLHNKTDYSGTGIGLAICKKIVERHGGRIWVDSAPGRGSTFYFTIAKNQ